MMRESPTGKLMEKSIYTSQNAAAAVDTNGKDAMYDAVVSSSGGVF